MKHEPNGHEEMRRGNEAGESPKAELEEQVIRERAYLIWVDEGMPEGREVEHWMRARRELGRDLDVGSD